MKSESSNKGTIRSFVRREGRITGAQKRALERLWPHYGIDVGEGFLDWASIFNRNAPTHCEIGFGNGEALLHMATEYPEVNFVGVEVYRPGVGALLVKIQQQGITNIRIAQDDAVQFIRQRVAPISLDKVLVFFPDPWPKKRHHKRRLMQNDFVNLVASRLTDEGVIHCATDWQEYADHMLQVLSDEPAFINQSLTGDFCQRPSYRIQTKYERRGDRLGHATWDLVFKKSGENKTNSVHKEL